VQLEILGANMGLERFKGGLKLIFFTLMVGVWTLESLRWEANGMF